MKKTNERVKITRPTLWFVNIAFPLVGIGFDRDYIPYKLNAGVVVNMSVGMMGICAGM